MSGELALGKLLATVTATMADDIYVFATFANNQVPSGLKPLMQFHEQEGTTLILTREAAEKHNIPYEFPCRMITLNVHSSLEAVGFIAVIATELAKQGMGVNPVAGFFHDHLFIPLGREHDALKVIKDIAAKAQTN